MQYILVLVTVSSTGEGRRIAKNLVKKKLAACVSQVPGMTSIYWWKGKMESAREDLLIIKTLSTKLLSLIKEVKQTHCYAVPEIIALPIAKGNPDYLSWIKQSLRN